MRSLRVFFAHELATQIRSARFHGVTLAYLVATTTPAVVVYVFSRKVSMVLTSAMYGTFLDLSQPLATTLFGAAIAVDVLLRERDENSLGVVAMAPISATGYVLSRWLAVVGLLLPVTLIPRIAAIALVAQAERAVPDVTPILLGWAIKVAPVLIVVTALAMALGAITGRVVLALLLGLGLFTVAFGIANDLLAYAHHQIAGASDFFGLVRVSNLSWLLRGYFSFSVPSAAGYPLAEEWEAFVRQSAFAIGIAALLLGISCAYLRRTKRDIRPWKIREDHPLRSFLGTLNRFREEFTPDGGLEIPERTAIVLGVLALVAALVMITQRYDAFERLAAERFAAQTEGVEPMPDTIVPVAAALRGRIARSGELDVTATLTMRNDGSAPQRELAFALNRGILIDCVTATRGTVKVGRVWERVGIALEPPLAPAESRTFTFTMHGPPGTYVFELPYGSTFDEAWRRYLTATTSNELADLSRSFLRRDAKAERMFLEGASLFPVPRYSPWLIPERRWSFRSGETPEPTFTREAIRPRTPLSVDLEIPEGFTAIDACGSVATKRLVSRCSFAIGEYLLLGARYRMMPITSSIRLAYLPPHAQLARAHALSIAGAIDVAKQTWPSFAMPERAVFVERPSWSNERYGDGSPFDVMNSVSMRGAISILPEPLVVIRRPIDRSSIAAALITSHLASRRPLEKREHSFFIAFYATIGTWRTGQRQGTAVEPPIGGRPLTDAIIGSGDGGWRGPIRLRRVLADIDYRIGTERLMAGVEDFLNAGPQRGSAKELLEAIGRRGGIDLDRYYADYFIGTELPRLTLVGVTFVRTDGGWEARGALKNEAGGEVFCPLVLRTASGAVRTTLRVDARSSTPFVLRSPHEPRILQLDPEKVVYRHAAVGLTESVDYKEPS